MKKFFEAGRQNNISSQCTQFKVQSESISTHDLITRHKDMSRDDYFGAGSKAYKMAHTEALKRI